MADGAPRSGGQLPDPEFERPRPSTAPLPDTPTTTEPNTTDGAGARPSWVGMTVKRVQFGG